VAFGTIDIIAFIAFILAVVGISLYASRNEETSEDYFLAGRGLNWWLIGLSLIASNISSEHFIGMSGKGFSLGLAIASYEWMAAVTLIIVALFFLPRFLRAGIYTIPEFLEYRYDRTTRLIMAFYMMVFYVIVTLATVLYSGALALNSIFGIDITLGIWIIGILAGAYTVYGGLKAVVWSDLIQGTALILGGVLVMFLGFQEMGIRFAGGDAGGFVANVSNGIGSFMDLAGDRLHTVLPSDHPELPWVAVFIGGLWIPNLYYWGLNQFITQRTLAAKSLLEGQKGILFGATIKLFIPFIVVFPGIMAFLLYGDEVMAATGTGDGAYPYLLRQLLPAGLMGVMFAALFGAVMSTLDSLLNSAATIFTMDIYRPYMAPDAPSAQYVRIGRITTMVLVLIGCLWAPVVGRFDSVFDYIQKFGGLIQPGILGAFVFGILWKKVPAHAVKVAMVVNVPVYAALLLVDEFVFPEGEKLAFLHYMAVAFAVVSTYIIIATLVRPLKVPVTLPVKQDYPTRIHPLIAVWSALVLVAVAGLYVVFR